MTRGALIRPQFFTCRSSSHIVSCLLEFYNWILTSSIILKANIVHLFYLSFCLLCAGPLFRWFFLTLGSFSTALLLAVEEEGIQRDKMAEISLDSDTHIKDMDDSNSHSQKPDSQKTVASTSSSKTPRSVIVKISKEKLEKSSSDEKSKATTSKNSSSTSKSSSSSTVSTQKKKELLKKAQQVKERLAKEKEKNSTVSKSDVPEKAKEPPVVPQPLPVPENYNIPRRESQTESSTPKSRSPSVRHRDDARASPRRSRSPRVQSRGNDRGSSRSARSRSPRRSRTRSASRRRSRSPYYRRRRSPSRSRSREFRPYFARSPRRRSPSPYVRRRFSPPRIYRPRDRSCSRSPGRYGPPRWQRGEDRFSGPREDGFARGPPPRPDFHPPWERGVPSQPPGVSHGFSRGQSDFTGFSDHSEQWGMPPNRPPQNSNIHREQLPPSTTPMLAIPPEMIASNTAQQSMIDSLKEELKGLSQTMLSFTSQMGKSTQSVPDVSKTPAISSQKEIVHSSPGTTTVVQPAATPIPDIVSTDLNVSSRSTDKTASCVQPETDEMEVSSESGGESSDGEDSSSEESGEDSDDNTSVIKKEGFLEWTALNSLIVEKFQDRINPEESNVPAARIDNLGGLTERKETERIRLPMFPPIKDELFKLSVAIRNPPSKARARRDSLPLGRGVFPEAEKGLPIQALSEDLRFNQPAQLDAGIERLLPPKKSSFNVQGRFSDENLRKMERDLRVNLSSLSYALWSLDYTTQSLCQMRDASQNKDTLVPCISACKHALSFLTSVVDRSATTLATTVLARRDSYLSQMDPLLPEEDHITLRASSFLDTSLFAGNTCDLVPKLDNLRRESQSRESVDVLTSLAKKGVQGSTSQKSTAGSGFSKKKSKKHSKKKGSKKSGTSTAVVTTTTDQPASGGIQRTFRNKGKKSSKK